ncbi:MAG: S8 family serine peptidase [Bacilli bacterium]|nr:S8 family serine peptidase [Bacilli bacterium]
MKIRLNRCINIFLFICLVALFVSFVFVKVHGTSAKEEKYYCNATIDDSFSNDSVLVILNKEASYRLKEYDENDFSDINCEKVINLTGTAKKTAVEKRDNPLVNIDNYRCTLCIKLKEKSKEKVLNTIKELMKRDDVIYAGPDYIMNIKSATPNDLYVSSQWGINSINLPWAWDFSIGSNSIVVGVVDTGIDADHPDLFGRVNVSLSRDFTTGEEIQPETITDPHGHGTHVAGIIGAIGNNGIGISGVAWNVNFASLRVFDENGDGLTSSVFEAIDYAEKHSISLLNYSGGWYENYDSNYFALNTIFSIYNGLLVCSAGNENYDNDQAYTCLPASADLDNIISVGAINSNDERWVSNALDGSNYGEETVDIFAPGEYILSTFISTTCTHSSIVFGDGTRLCEFHEGNIELLEEFREEHNLSWNNIIQNFVSYFGYSPSHYLVSHYQSDGHHYYNLSGTSMAAPFVTGVAVLLLSINPNLTVSQLKTAIMNSAEIPNVNGINPLEDLCVTDGKLDAYGAVKYVLENYLDSSSILNLNCATSIHTSTKSCSEGNSIIYKINVDCARSYKFISNSVNSLDMTFYDSSFNEITSITPIMINNNCTGVITTYLNPGTYYLRVCFLNNTDSGNITTSYQVTWPSIATFNTSLNLLPYLHLIDTNTYHCVINFNNTYGEKLFKFKLDAGSNATYSAGVIKVYTDSNLTNQLDRYSINNLSIPATSNINENELYVFLPENGLYYIEITVPRNDYNSLELLISNIDEMSIDYLSTLATSTLTNIFSSKTEASYF